MVYQRDRDRAGLVYVPERDLDGDCGAPRGQGLGCEEFDARVLEVLDITVVEGLVGRLAVGVVEIVAVLPGGCAVSWGLEVQDGGDVGGRRW